MNITDIRVYLIEIVCIFVSIRDIDKYEYHE